MRRLFLVVQVTIGSLLALFITIQNLPSKLSSMNVSALTNLFLNSVVLFTMSGALVFAFRDRLLSAKSCSQAFLTLALGAAFGSAALVVASLANLVDLNATSTLGLVLLGPVLGLSIGCNVIFFGLFRQVERRRLGQKISSVDLTVRQNFVSVIGFLNAYVSPPLVLLSFASEYVFAASLVVLQIVVSAFAFGLYRITIDRALRP
jgi:hypothetical protein